MKTLKYLMMVLVGVLIIVGNTNANFRDMKVTSPKGGDIWFIGDTKPITWNYSGPDCRLTIKLRYGMQPLTIAENIPANQRRYLWRVGDYIGGRALPDTNCYKIDISIQPSENVGCERAAQIGSEGWFTLANREIQKAPGMPPVKGVGSRFKCTYKPQVSGLPAGGPAGGTGEFQYGMTIKVENVGSTKFYEVYSNLQLKVNGVNKNKTCSLPPGVMNQYSLDTGKSATHYLNCGTESNVTSSEIISSQAYVQSNDGKKFYCTPDTSVPKVY